MIIRKRIGRLTRTIEVPVCADCHRELQKMSAKEEKMRSIGRLASISGGLGMLIILFLIMPDDLTAIWKLIIAAFASAILGVIIYFYFDRRRQRGVRPEKKAIQSSASMLDFSWRATTFEFHNESFASRFEDLNKRNLMEVEA